MSAFVDEDLKAGIPEAPVQVYRFTLSTSAQAESRKRGTTCARACRRKAPTDALSLAW